MSRKKLARSAKEFDRRFDEGEDIRVRAKEKKY